MALVLAIAHVDLMVPSFYADWRKSVLEIELSEYGVKCHETIH